MSIVPLHQNRLPADCFAPTKRGNYPRSLLIRELRIRRIETLCALETGALPKTPGLLASLERLTALLAQETT